MSDSNKALALFDGMPTGEMQQIERDTGLTPYITFANAKSPSWDKVVAAVGAVPEGTPLLFMPDGRIFRLDAMRFWLTPMYYQHWSEVDEQNTLLRSYPSNPRTKGAGETIESVIIAITPSGPIPARMRFRTTKTPAAHDMINAVVATGQPGWAKSPDQQAVLNIPQAWLRIVGEMVLTPKPKTETRKRAYVQANAHPHPATAGQLAMLGTARKDDGWNELFREVVDDYNRAVEEVKKKQ